MASGTDNGLPACCAASSNPAWRLLPTLKTHLFGNISRSIEVERDKALPTAASFKGVSRTMPRLLKSWPFANCLPFFYQVWPPKKRVCAENIFWCFLYRITWSPQGFPLARHPREMVCRIFFRATEKFPLEYRKRFCSWYLPVKNTPPLGVYPTETILTSDQSAFKLQAMRWGSVTMVVTSFRLTHQLSQARNECTMGMTTEENDFRQTCFCQILITQFKKKKKRKLHTIEKYILLYCNDNSHIKSREREKRTINSVECNNFSGHSVMGYSRIILENWANYIPISLMKLYY